MSFSNQLISPIAQYLANFQRFYPGIMDWYSGVKCDFALGRRKMFMVCNGSKILGLAITKNGYRAKLCHISVANAARDRRIGSILARLALRDMIKNGAGEIRVSTGEEVYREHASFFQSLGFREVDWQVNRYRRNVAEILWRLKPGSDLFCFKSNNCRQSHNYLDNIKMSDTVHLSLLSGSGHLLDVHPARIPEDKMHFPGYN